MKRNRAWLIVLFLVGSFAVLNLGQFSFDQVVSKPFNSGGFGAIAMAQVEKPASSSGEATDLPDLRFPITGTFEDPAGRFQIGLLENFAVSIAAGTPVFEAPDGALSYGVVLKAKQGGEFAGPMTDAALAALVQTTFKPGEGFQTTGFQPLPEGRLQINWQGSLTRGGVPQPIEGSILALQSDTTVAMLVVAAIEPGLVDLPVAFSTLANSLQLR